VELIIDGVEFWMDGPSFLYISAANRAVRMYRRREWRIKWFVMRSLGVKCVVSDPVVDCRNGRILYRTDLAGHGHVAVGCAEDFRPPYRMLQA